MSERSPAIASSTSAEPGLSVVIPVFNERASLKPLCDELLSALGNAGRSFEIIFVDDGSMDGSGDELDRLAESDPRMVVLHFRRNLGQTAALTAGIDASRGVVIVPLDADLQNDPRDIVPLVDALHEGNFDVVSGWRRARQDAFFTRTLPSRVANWGISVLTGVRLHDFGCSLKAYRREVMEGVRLYGEMHRFIPVYVAMQGGRVGEKEVRHRARVHGQSKYGMGRIGKVILDLMLVKFLASYASKPIYIFGGFGLTCLLLSLFPALLALWFKLQPEGPAQKDFVETPLPVVAAVLVIAGFLGILMGLLAEILMRTYFESQGKRTYSLRRVIDRRPETHQR